MATLRSVQLVNFGVLRRCLSHLFELSPDLAWRPAAWICLAITGFQKLSSALALYRHPLHRNSRLERYQSGLSGLLAIAPGQHGGVASDARRLLREELNQTRPKSFRASALNPSAMLLRVLISLRTWAKLPFKRKKISKIEALENQKFALDQHAIVSITDPDQTIIYANEKFLNIMEYQEKQVLGKKRDLVNSGIHGKDFFDAIWSAARKGQVWHGEICNKSATGRLYWLDSTFVPILNRHGALDRCIIIETDITNRKALEQDLESSRAYLQSVTDSMGEGIYTLDANGNCTFLNAEAERLIGWPFQEVKGLRIHDVIHFQDGNGAPIPACDCPILHALQEGRKLQCEDQYFTHRSGRMFPVSLISVRLEQNGEFIGSVLVFQDITERRRIQDALQKSEQRLNFALSASGTGLWDFNPVTGETFFSDTYFTMLGYAAGAFPASWTSFLSLMNADDRALFENIYFDHVHGKRPAIEAEFRLRRHDGSWAWIKSVGRIIDRCADGAPARLTGIHIDVSAAQKSQAELAEAKEVAIQASQIKSNFLAVMSHEIRTPLNGIIGLSHLMSCTELSPRQLDYLKKIQIASKSLLAIINDILDFSKIEAGKLGIEKAVFDIDEMLENVAAVIAPKIREKGLELVVFREPCLPGMLLGDSLRFGQVLLNLLSNAAKFTPKGEVSVKIGGHVTEATQFMLEVAVSDTGIGMNAGQCAALFQPFVQADASISRRFGGTGLGLAISKHLVSLLGGHIDVESTEGKGTVFHFNIPAGLPNQETSLATASHLLEGKRVLVADDCLAARNAARIWLEYFGLDISVSSNMQDVLQKLETGEKFDLILLDYPLPGLVDPASIEQLWQHASFAPIILTTTQRKEDLEIQLHNILTSAGSQPGPIACVMEKPLMRGSLLEHIEAALAPGERKTDVKTEIPQPLASIGWPGTKVLLIEDNSINQQVAKELLEKLGIEITVAGCGRTALALLQEHKFDLILMDVHMPDMDGFAVTAEIRHTLGINGIPIIAVTADAMAGVHDNCLQAGMNDHIAKPFDPDVLVHKLARWLQTSRTAIDRMEFVDGPSARPDLLALPDELQTLDLSLGLRNLNGNRALLLKLLREFMDQQIHQIAALNQAVQDADWLSVQQIAHSIKGCAATLGATHICAISTDLEQLGGGDSKGGFSERAKGLIDKLQQAFRETRENIARLMPSTTKMSHLPPVETLAETRQTIKNLALLLTDSNPDAEHEAIHLAKFLADTKLASVGLDLHRLASRFDFEDALKLLNEISLELENAAAA